jgi:hypothetical protein
LDRAGPHFETLNPGLADFPSFVAGQAIRTAVSPDNRTLLILTSGYNLNAGLDGKNVVSASQEYVFVYDIGGSIPKQRQVLKVPNTFAGICFSPEGKEFYISGGKDDNVDTFSMASSGQWHESALPIPLGHHSGLGLNTLRARPTRETLRGIYRGPGERRGA